MTKVKRNYYLPGARYSQNKTTIKGLFTKYGLKWKGSMEFPRWTSGSETVTAEFIRENEVTVGANLTFNGDPLCEFCIDFTKLMAGLGAEYDDIEVVSDEAQNEQLDTELEEHMRHWDRVHRPNVEIMRKGTIHNGYKPVPESFINAAMHDFKEKRDAEIEAFKAKQRGEKPPAVRESAEPDIEADDLEKPVKKHKKVQVKEKFKSIELAEF